MQSRNANLRGFAERTAVNTPLQGTAADLIKIAMIRIDRRLREEKLANGMTLQVHDELLFDVPEKEVERVKELVRHEMEHGDRAQGAGGGGLRRWSKLARHEVSNTVSYNQWMATQIVRYPESQTLFIDADDTLWENNIYFEQAIADFISHLDHHVHTAQEVRSHLNQVEHETIKVHGYGLKNFHRSLLICFERLTEGPITERDREKVAGLLCGRSPIGKLNCCRMLRPRWPICTTGTN